MNIIETDKFYFPLTHFDQKTEYFIDIKNPLTIRQEEIIKDMFKFTRDFPMKVIPHVTEQGNINDILHNYKRHQK